MALAPPAAPAAGPMGGGGMMAPADPMAAGAVPPAAGAGGGRKVLATICGEADGSFTVYRGDEPDADDSGADMSLDDTATMGGEAPAAPAADAGAGGDGQPANSVGEVLKITLDILKDAQSSEGMPGNADDQLSAGFSADKNPTAAGGPAKRF